ncbi:MAG: DUF4258 domain-containing protein [Gammaproteobacteria bacterium]
MEFRISQHAATEMRRRGIAREVVMDVLQNPQQIVIGRVGRNIYQSRFVCSDGKTYLVRVVVADDQMPSAVITVYRTSKVAKYWRVP